MRASWGHGLPPAGRVGPARAGLERVPVLAMADVLRRRSRSRGAARLLVKINTEGEECETVLGTPRVESWKDVEEAHRRDARLD